MNKIVLSAQAIEPTRPVLQTLVSEQHQTPTLFENGLELFFKACNPRQFGLKDAVETSVISATDPSQVNGEV